MVEVSLDVKGKQMIDRFRSYICGGWTMAVADFSANAEIESWPVRHATGRHLHMTAPRLSYIQNHVVLELLRALPLDPKRTRKGNGNHTAFSGNCTTHTFRTHCVTARGHARLLPSHTLAALIDGGPFITPPAQVGAASCASLMTAGHSASNLHNQLRFYAVLIQVWCIS
jgi:hypothetical protein